MAKSKKPEEATPDGAHLESAVSERIKDWLNTEGYPLEIKTANEFRKAGFHVRQGAHVRDEKTGAVREIDVLASRTSNTKDSGYIRIYHIIECKWSKDKPWVVFSSPHSSIHPSACINQTMGSLMGRAILWCMAGNTKLQSTTTFRAPQRPGFGGRQCFSKNSDLFYNAMQSVATATALQMDWYDNPAYLENGVPPMACIGLPCIVVDGELFEAFPDEQTGDLRTEPVDSIRIHWQGAEAWKYRTSVDIIRASHVSEFAKQRAAELPEIIDILSKSKENIEKCIKANSLDALTVEPGPRGTLGLPSLLRAIGKRQKK